MVEQLLRKQLVASSSLVSGSNPKIFIMVGSLMAKHRAVNAGIGGSNPPRSANLCLIIMNLLY